MLYRVHYIEYIYTSVDVFKMKIVVGALQHLEAVFSTFQAHILFSNMSPSKEYSIPHSDQARVLNTETFI